MRIDSHHHFWDTNRYTYPWMAGAEMDPIRRPIGPADLKPAIEAAGIDRTVIVQCLPDEGETRWFLEIAGATDFVGGVVGWVDLTAPDVADRLAALRAGPHGAKLLGIRHQVHDEPDPDWLRRADVGRGLAALGRAGVVYDLLLRPRELGAALAAVRAHPETRFVIDHLAKPLIAERVFEPWASDIAPFGELPNVWCKVSGMVTEAKWRGWRRIDFERYVDHALDVFGPDRLMFGSDWPVCLLAADYGQVVDLAAHCLSGLTVAEQARAFGETAAVVYGID